MLKLCGLCRKLLYILCFYRGLVGLGTLVTESPSKIRVTSIIVTDSAFMLQLKKNALLETNADANRQKVMTCAQQILQIL